MPRPAPARPRYGQLFLPLLQVCHRKLQYPPDGDELDPDEEALFRDYRDDIRDNICTIQIMMGAQCQATLISTGDVFRLCFFGCRFFWLGGGGGA